MKNPFKKLSSLSSEAKAGLALSLGAVVIFSSAAVLSNVGSSEKSSSNNSITSSQGNGNTSSSSSKATSYEVVHTSPSTPFVDVMLEEVIKPYQGSPELMRCFYEKEDPIETRTKAIVKVPGSSKYIKSLGCDYAFSDAKEFNVVASLSGVVKDKFNDSMYGEVLVIEHQSGIQLYYASLANVKVNKGDNVKQGDIIATSGLSLYTEEIKNSLHFEVIKDGTRLNPEKVYSTTVKEI